ncbi:MAG: ATP-binding protein [Pseudomonadota bacterium]
MATRDLTPLRRLFTGPVLTGILAILLIASLYLLSGMTDTSARFSQLYGVLLGVNLLALLVLLALIIRGLARLIRQVRRDEPGSRLTLRLVVVLALLATVPVSVIYTFSLGFLDRSIDSWFDIEVERALGDSLELSRAALSARTARHMNQTREMAHALVASHGDLGALLERMRKDEQASELTLIGGDGRYLAHASTSQRDFLPTPIPRYAAAQVRAGMPLTALEPGDPDGFQVRVLLHLPGSRSTLLQAIYPVSSELARLADEVEEGYRKYQSISFLRQPLQASFAATLTVVLMLAVLGGVWLAILLANRLVAPIRDLADGTRAVAAGDYTKRLPLPRAGDELGFLVRSFNEMTARVGRTQEAASRSQRQVETERAFLETVLACLSSGVLTLSADGRVLSCNRAAGFILVAPLDKTRGRTIHSLAANAPHLEPFVHAVAAHLEQPDDRSETVTLFTPQGQRLLTVHGSQLPAVEGGEPGHVVIFDDVTNLVQAQREAAWGEVARRLAHEIKNPLTPIRLAAERLRHRLMGAGDEEQETLLDRSTRTIIHQVEGLESMVRAFADYARTPPREHQPIDLNELLMEIVELYRDDSARMLVNLDPRRPRIHGDPDRLRRILNNLVHNALEAVEGSPAEQRRVSLTSRCLSGSRDCLRVEIRVQDSGPGIPAEVRSQIFEPYVTTRERGTGLGLAIVKKAVEEHGGRIHIEDSPLGGACAVVVLPADGTLETDEDEPT